MFTWRVPCGDGYSRILVDSGEIEERKVGSYSIKAIDAVLFWGRVGGWYCHLLSSYCMPCGIFRHDSAELNKTRLCILQWQSGEQNWAIIPLSRTRDGVSRQHDQLAASPGFCRRHTRGACAPQSLPWAPRSLNSSGPWICCGAPAVCLIRVSLL